MWYRNNVKLGLVLSSVVFAGKAIEIMLIMTINHNFYITRVAGDANHSVW